METNKKGFTLVELLVVIVIIGILATIGISTFSGYYAKARDVKRKANLQQAKKVLLTVVIDKYNGVFDYKTLKTGADVNAQLKKGGFELEAEKIYKYRFKSSSDGKDFAFGICYEDEKGKGFITGTDESLLTTSKCNTGKIKAPTTDEGEPWVFNVP